MFVNVVIKSDFNQVIENLNPASMLVFCGHIVIAIEHLLDNVSVYFGIMIEQYLKAFESPIRARHAQQETASRHFILSIGVGRNCN
jgi:N-acyl-L-homoserine lactone synthetase